MGHNGYKRPAAHPVFSGPLVPTQRRPERGDRVEQGSEVARPSVWAGTAPGRDGWQQPSASNCSKKIHVGLAPESLARGEEGQKPRHGVQSVKLEPPEKWSRKTPLPWPAP